MYFETESLQNNIGEDLDRRNRNFEKIETDTTLMATNLVSNGDFSNGTTNWYAVSGVSSLVGSVLKFTANAYTGRAYSRASLVSQNKYYLFADIATSGVTVEVGLTYMTNTTGTLIRAKAITGVQRLSGVLLATTTSPSVDVGIIDYRYSGWDEVSIYRMGVINLTATFGKGNEPTAEQMDAILAKFTNSWFDGTKNLFQAKASLNKLMAVDARTEFEAKNLVGNGSFEGLISPWLTYGTSTSGLSVRDISTSKKVSGISSVYVKRALGESAGYGYQQKVNIILGNKVYLRAAAYIPSSSLSPVVPTVSIEGVPYGYVRFLTDVKDAWQYKSAIFTQTATGAVSCILQVVSDVTYDGECYFDDITVIDLTATFGAGKEPTLAEMDRLMARFPNSWFDGVKPIQTIETLYQEKANKVQEAWITPTLVNGWVEDQPVRYIKDSFGFVHLKGALKTGLSGTAAFNLPIGYRPPQTTRIPTNTSGVFGYVSILSTGEVFIFGTTSGGCYVDSITFKVD